MARIIVIIGVLIIVFWDKLKEMCNMDSSKIKGNAPAGLQKVANKYGVEFARNIERLLRLETAHFKSSQWLKCGTAGMVATSTKFPFGWGSLRKFAEKKNIDSDQFGIVYFANTSDGKPRNYIKFPDTGLFVEFLADFIQDSRNGNYLAWYSLNETQQQKYKQALEKIKTKFV
jgi:hypothetical protein